MAPSLNFQSQPTVPEGCQLATLETPIVRELLEMEQHSCQSQLNRNRP